MYTFIQRDCKTMLVELSSVAKLSSSCPSESWCSSCTRTTWSRATSRGIGCPRMTSTPTWTPACSPTRTPAITPAPASVGSVTCMIVGIVSITHQVSQNSSCKSTRPESTTSASTRCGLTWIACTCMSLAVTGIYKLNIKHYNFNNSNTEGTFNMADSNSFLSP